MGLHLVIANKNYSSWSMRPWIAMKVAGIPFEETVIPLYEPGSAEKIATFTPAGKVPVLIADGQSIWESLAILEYLAETFPDAGLWPADRAARIHARVVANEMHGGFQPLRKHLPMNLWRVPKPYALPDDVVAQVKRIDELWTDCRARFGKGGPFLFGAYGNADSMFAPVVARLHSYAVPVSDTAKAYMQAVMDLPAWREWADAGLREPWVMQGNEVDWPNIDRIPAPK